MDRKTLAAIVLCIAFMLLYRPLLHWLGWDKYLEPPRPVAVDTTRVDTTGFAARPNSLAPGSTPASGQAPAIGPKPTEPPASGGSLFAAPVQPEAQFEHNYELETPLYRATFSSRGARLVSVELLQYASAHGASGRGEHLVQVAPGRAVSPGDRVVLAGGPLFRLDLGSSSALRSLENEPFAVRESLDAAGHRVSITFIAQAPGGALIRQTYRSRPDNYVIDYEVEVRGLPAAWRVQDYSLTTRSWTLVTEADLIQDARSLRATSLVGENVHRIHAPQLVTAPKSFEGNARWAAVQTRYFLSAMAVADGTPRGVVSAGERRPLTPEEVKLLDQDPAKARMEFAQNTLVMGLPSELKPVQRFVLYAGPSEFFRLKTLGVGLERVVDLGWTWVQPVSQLLLQLLKWLYGIFHNYGIAIILLATLVRLVLHPLNMTSMKNMRVMQRLQPQLERIKEKYKNDPAGLNTAMMALYKDNKANPAGGCLPMVVQIPLFIALYQVLFNAIELRQAPFVGWIHDLSAPDSLFRAGPLPMIGFLHIRLLPLLMMGAGFVQQRLTPTDPRQLPTMYLMNLFMLVFFYNLPSGLVLYWTLMNVLTALQQWMVLRQDGGSVATVLPDPVPVPGKGRKRQVTPPAAAK